MRARGRVARVVRVERRVVSVEGIFGWRWRCVGGGAGETCSAVSWV